MQKLRLGTIVLAAESGALQALTNQKPQNESGPERSRFAYRLASIRSALIKQIDERSVYFEQRKLLEAANLEEIEKDGQITREFKSPKVEHKHIFNEELQNLMGIEVEVNVPTVSIDELARFGIEITPEQMSLLSFAIIDPLVAEPAPLPA